MMSHLEQAYEFDIRIRLYDDRAAPDGVVILAEDIGEGVVHEKGGVKITAFENKAETQSGRFAAQNRYAWGKPICAAIEKMPGHINTTIRFPRPAGPRAHALRRLVTTPKQSISTFVLKTNLMLRFSICRVRPT